MITSLTVAHLSSWNRLNVPVPENNGARWVWIPGRMFGTR